MGTVQTIKEEVVIRDMESFAFYAGQIVYYLLSLSEKKEKRHSLVEPFINIPNLKLFSLKINELFNAYKHAVYFNHRRFNELFSSLWAFLYDNSDKKFNNELRILFYAGYFDNNNILYTNQDKEDQDGNE